MLLLLEPYYMSGTVLSAFKKYLLIYYSLPNSPAKGAVLLQMESSSAEKLNHCPRSHKGAVLLGALEFEPRPSVPTELAVTLLFLSLTYQYL